MVHSAADELPDRPMQDNADIGVRMDIMLMRELARSFIETNTQSSNRQYQWQR